MWPKALQEKCPCARGSVPTRPWWKKQYNESGGVSAVLRTDGATWRWIPGLLNSPEEDRRRSHEAFHEDALGEYDAKKPMPHPGFREGQVWADEHGEARVVVGLICGDPASLERVYVPEYRADVFTQEPMDTRRFCYLVADPCCPHLAPWMDLAPLTPVPHQGT